MTLLITGAKHKELRANKPSEIIMSTVYDNKEHIRLISHLQYHGAYFIIIIPLNTKSQIENLYR